MRTKESLIAAVALLVMVSLPGFSLAATINLEATIDGAQASTGSLATGSATMTLDDVTNLFSWDISWSGLSGPVSVAHFHGPALPGVPAGVQLDFAAISGSTSPSIGSSTISAGQAADLLAGLWYINIHTAAYQGGEIRGQVLTVPEPATLLLVLGGAGLLVWVGRRRSD